jgi:hypothetical protein
MSKRWFFCVLPSIVLASLVFATPSPAGTVYTVTTDVTFSVNSGGTASDVEVTYTPSVDPISGLTLTPGLTGGLSGLGISETPGSPSVIEVTFAPAGSTSGTLEWTFQTASPPAMYAASGSGVASGDTITLSTAVTSSAVSIAPQAPVPEPTSAVLWGLGMAGFLACRRYFTRAAHRR